MAQVSQDGLCTTCRSRNHYCWTCGQPVLQDFSFFDEAGPYCVRCLKDRKRCDTCGAPLTEEKWSLSDGREICRYCQASAVFATQEAARLFEEVKAILRDRLEIKLNIPTGLILVDRDQLRDVFLQQRAEDNLEEDGSISFSQILGVYVRRGMRRGIYIQTGLPKATFSQVAAHELAHAWQGENCPTLENRLIHEGFAEWVAFQVAGSMGYSRIQAQMLKRDDIYGEGLRWALEVEKQHGAKSVLDACRMITETRI